MKTTETRVFRGPNLYSLHHPVIRYTLDLEELEEYPSNRLGDFVDRLMAAIPSLWTHRCSEGEEGGFYSRLVDGTWMGHIIEHVALELQSLAGTPTGFGKTRGTGAPGVYYVVFSFEQEKVGLMAGDLAWRLVTSLMPPELPSAMPEEERQQFHFQQELEALTRLAAEVALGPSTRALVEAAERRDIPWIRLNEHSLVQLGYGRYQKRIQATVTSATNYIATDIASDKRLTNQLLDDSGIPVPCHDVANSEEDAVRIAEKIGYPVVTKPLNLNQGRGASMDLRDAEMVREGFRVAQAAGGLPVVVEAFLTGNDYRILVVNDRVVAVSQRIPAQVIGDGIATIRELVERVNADPRRGIGHEKVLTRITINHQAERLLKQAGYTLDSVLVAGEVFRLASTANMSTGGTAIDRTDQIHYENIEIARRAVRVIGLDVAGIDLITPDISRPLREVGGGIVEINAGPGFRMHVSPTEGRARDVAGPVIDMLFPPGTPSRIPMAAVTGTNGKTTTTFMVGHILKAAGYKVGLTSTNGVYIDGKRYLEGDMTGPWSARMVLQDSQIEAAVLETARGGILREGIGFDRCDVGAILNVTADHLGLRGVETVEQMAEVKGLIAELVSPDGYVVLNADDPLVAPMAKISPGEPIYFCMSLKNRLVKDHISQGGKAVVLEKGMSGDMISLYDGSHMVPILWAHQIPATLDGRARFNIANAMAAAAVAFGLGVRIEDIRHGLVTFATTYDQVPGRLNIYDECGFRVIVDYAHNAAAMQAMTDLVRGMRRPNKIGVISAAGDRRDADIRELGRMTGETFDEMIIKEDKDRRGRAPGEIGELLRAGMLEGGMRDELITVMTDEMEGVQVALERARPGDLVVIFADDVPGVWEEVVKWNRCEKERVSTNPAIQ